MSPAELAVGVASAIGSGLLAMAGRWIYDRHKGNRALQRKRIDKYVENTLKPLLAQLRQLRRPLEATIRTATTQRNDNAAVLKHHVSQIDGYFEALGQKSSSAWGSEVWSGDLASAFSRFKGLSDWQRFLWNAVAVHEFSQGLEALVTLIDSAVRQVEDGGTMPPRFQDDMVRLAKRLSDAVSANS